jgi:16S rRNA (cytidine1402-2'-O)-methyltransferase
MGTLYLVGTPIGNLEDITLRALRVLREVDVIAAEDTRTTRKLLSHYDIHTPLTSYHDYSGPQKTAALVARLETSDVALVSEAGMPGLSDPGYPLVQAALAAGRTVTTVPGPSALVSALVLSGLPTHACHYLGFAPRKAGGRRRLLERVEAEEDTLLLYESPHRIVAMLRDIVDVLGPDRPVAAARELTKQFEEVVRGTAASALAHFERSVPRGEFTLVIGGNSEQRPVPGRGADSVRTAQRGDHRARRSETRKGRAVGGGMEPREGADRVLE